MLNFKQYVGIVRSTILIVEEEREVFFETIFPTIIYFDDLNFSSWDQEAVDKILNIEWRTKMNWNPVTTKS